MEKDLSGLKRDLDKLLSCDNLKVIENPLCGNEQIINN